MKIRVLRAFIGSFLLMAFFTSAAQVEEPVIWNFSARKIADKKFEIKMVAMVQPGWHIYSQSTPAGGPLPTVIKFNKNPLVTFVGKVHESGKMEQLFEPMFGVDVKQYSNRVEFTQTITLKTSAKTAISGSVEYMSCNEEMCLPPIEQEFRLTIE